MEIDGIELGPRAQLIGVPHVAGTKEYLVCTEGSIRIRVEGKEYAVEAGDVLAFPGDISHAYFNPARTPARAVSVVVLARHL